jgi:hypothetical protein
MTMTQDLDVEAPADLYRRYRRTVRRSPQMLPRPTGSPRCGCCGLKVVVKIAASVATVSFPCRCQQTKEAGAKCYRCEHCTDHCSCGPDLAGIRRARRG